MTDQFSPDLDSAARESQPKLSKRKIRSRETFQEYRQYSDAFSCTFREWLDIRKTQRYIDIKAGRRVAPWWEIQSEYAE
jgi:hypothetical protein